MAGGAGQGGPGLAPPPQEPAQPQGLPPHLSQGPPSLNAAPAGPPQPPPFGGYQPPPGPNGALPLSLFCAEYLETRLAKELSTLPAGVPPGSYLEVCLDHYRHERASWGVLKRHGNVPCAWVEQAARTPFGEILRPVIQRRRGNGAEKFSWLHRALDNNLAERIAFAFHLCDHPLNYSAFFSFMPLCTSR